MDHIESKSPFDNGIKSMAEGAAKLARAFGISGIHSREPAFTAQELLGQAQQHMLDRAVTYDQPEGERSMAATVAAFNAITGRNLSESDGWLLMACLKMVRGESSRTPHRDSVEDLVSYAALYGEAKLAGLR